MNKLHELIREYCKNGVEVKLLKDCCNILDNKRKPVAKSLRIKGEYPYYGANGIQDYVSDYLFDGEYVLVGEDGSVVTEKGTPFVTWAKGKIWVNNHAHIISEKEGVLLRYLFHYLQKVNISQYVHGNIPKLTGMDFKNIEIYVPHISVQEEIVRILDSFTELTDELTDERAARKKQYEIYREKVIKTYCEGAEECLALNDILDYEQPTKYIVSSTKYNDRYDTPVLTAGQSFILGYTDESEGIYRASKNKEVILFDDFTTSFKWVDFSFKVKSSAIKILTPKDPHKTILKYIYYAMQCIDYQPTSHERQWIGKYSQFSIPVPSIEVQKKIVDKLERFDKLCNDISNGLPAEIKARQKQYEYYRDKLLTFKERKVEDESI